MTLKPNLISEIFASLPFSNRFNRGHTLFWSVDSLVQEFVKEAAERDATELENMVFDRLEAMVERYKGKITNWDVFNEVRYNIIKIINEFQL